jgi:hypothetical protein
MVRLIEKGRLPLTPQSSRQLQDRRTGRNGPELSDKQLDLGYAATVLQRR